MALPALFHLVPIVFLMTPVDQAISTRDMCEALDAQLAAIDGKSIRFRLNKLSSAKGSHEPPEGRPAPEDIGLVFECTSVVSEAGKKYRYEQRCVAASVLRDFIGETQIYTWDGAQARQATISKAGEGKSGQIEAQPSMSHYMSVHPSWQGWWVLQYHDRLSYGDLLQSERCKGPDLLDDGTTEWVYTYAESQLVEASLLGRRGANGVPGLTRVQFRSNREVDGVKRLVVSMTIEFGPPAEGDGAGLPTSAVIIFRHYRDDPKDEFWQRSEIVLTSVTPTEIKPDLFKVEFKPPMSVADARYRIGYRLGDTDLNLDGRLVVTHIPLEGDVGDKLEWWIQNGVMTSLRDPEADRPKKDGNPSSGKE